MSNCVYQGHKHSCSCMYVCCTCNGHSCQAGREDADEQYQGPSIALAHEVLQVARDHEKWIYGGAGVGAREFIPFLRLVKELAEEVIEAHESMQNGTSEASHSGSSTHLSDDID